ncbi:DM13 domain-containing protein [Pseudarthrobacter oxydans]|uniref:DM13 domain-containing protein n=1 Tax=Pseudarthrobacter oxydans TaxID=1671 RepID=UPI0037FE29B1
MPEGIEMPAHRKARAMPIGQILVVAVVAVMLAGCTYAEPTAAPDTESPGASASVPGPSPTPTSVAESWGAPMSGQFISQVARTTGGVSITGTAAGATLTLEGVSIDPGPDVRVVLNEGALSKDPSGNMVVQDPKSMDIGAQLKPGTGSQSFELPPFPPFKVRSITIMDWQNHIAYGTADLTPIG